MSSEASSMTLLSRFFGADFLNATASDIK
jgi:hypothetical protein